MQKILLNLLIKVILGMLSDVELKPLARKICQGIRECVLGTATTLDDKLVLPLLEKVEKEFGLDE